MKYLFIAFLWLCSVVVHAQQWPRNTKNKIEFRGLLPWPASSKTDIQRQALVRKWYLMKLTDSSPAEVAEQAATNQTNGLLTYAKLPKVAGFAVGETGNKILLLYSVTLIPSAAGVAYQINNFSVSALPATDEVELEDGSAPLESRLSTPDKTEQAALAIMRKRLAAAVAGWG